jgi:hypothetical protein
MRGARLYSGAFLYTFDPWQTFKKLALASYIGLHLASDDKRFFHRRIAIDGS